MSDNQDAGYIDAHVHVWSNDLQRYPVAPGFTVEDMNPPAYVPDQILHDARPHGVDRVVLVQMNYYGFDNSFMLQAIRQSPTVFRGIAIVDGKGDRPDVQMRSLAKLGIRGFRLYPEEVNLSVLGGEGYRKMFTCGAEERLALCLLMNPNSLSDLNRHCQDFPDTPVVIDHLARIGMGGPIGDSEIRALCILAKHAQVTVKLSGFYALGQAKPPHLDLVPLIQRVYEAFGPKRLMWGSDCPFQVAHETYDDCLSLVRDRLDFIPPEDKSCILILTAEELFFR